MSKQYINRYKQNSDNTMLKSMVKAFAFITIGMAILVIVDSVISIAYRIIDMIFETF
jgi:hypothetical protein